MKQLLAAALLGAAAFAGVAMAQQDYPNKPVRIVVPFPAGGTTDILTRAISQKLSEDWKQPVVVDNRAGAGGNIGADLVAKSTPDGYTLLMGAVATHAINPTLYSKIPYDPVKDFAPVALVAQVPNILVVNPAVPATTVRELIDLARAKPGYLNFGSGSTGSTGHLAGELFKAMAGVQMVHIPYKGTGPELTDLLAGVVRIAFETTPAVLPHVKAGKLRALAVNSLKRTPLLPDLPTMSEAGLSGFEVTSWNGVLAPAGTPKEIVTRLNNEIVKALKMPDVHEKLSGLGADPVGNTPEQFAAFIQAEIKKWAKVIKESGARVD